MGERLRCGGRKSGSRVESGGDFLALRRPPDVCLARQMTVPCRNFRLWKPAHSDFRSRDHARSVEGFHAKRLRPVRSFARIFYVTILRQISANEEAGRHVSGRAGVPPADSRVSRESPDVTRPSRRTRRSPNEGRRSPDGPGGTPGPAGETPTLPDARLSPCCASCKFQEMV